MRSTAHLSSRCWHVLRWVGLGAGATALWACTSRSLEMPTVVPEGTLGQSFTYKVNNNLDLLFMVDDSSSMDPMQQKLLVQLPNLMKALQGLPIKPNLHVAVVSSDLGAASDSNIGCSAKGQQGQFQFLPEGACTASTLTQGDTYISDVDGVANFTDPIADVFQCIALLGSKGCGFEHQLASIDRALGADGNGPPPSTNTGFLRDDAKLGIVMLTNEDDCSAPPDTTIFSLNGGVQNMSNRDGPIQNYRCNGGPRGGHLCKDLNAGSASSDLATPPLLRPSDAAGTPPALQLSDCQDNDSGSTALIPVSKFVDDIKQLKPDPDNQIFIGAIIAPPTPYGVEWDPPAKDAQNPQPGELWPQVQHSCGPPDAVGPMTNPNATQRPTDGSFGDPGVREAAFATSFQNSVVRSICDADYTDSMAAIAANLKRLLTPPCITAKLQTDPQGNPACAITDNLTDNQGHTNHLAIDNCNENGNVAPCWTMAAGDPNTSCTGQTIQVKDTAANMAADSQSLTVQCTVCLPGVPGPGC